LTLAVQSQWTDGLFDLAFAEDHPDIILTASGDGGIQLWDLKTPEVLNISLI
jgi:peroxin-7